MQTPEKRSQQLVLQSVDKGTQVKRGTNRSYSQDAKPWEPQELKPHDMKTPSFMEHKSICRENCSTCGHCHWQKKGSSIMKKIHKEHGSCPIMDKQKAGIKFGPFGVGCMVCWEYSGSRAFANFSVDSPLMLTAPKLCRRLRSPGHLDVVKLSEDETNKIERHDVENGKTCELWCANPRYVCLVYTRMFDRWSFP